MATLLLLTSVSISLDAKTTEHCCIAAVDCGSDDHGGAVLVCGNTLQEMVDEALEAADAMCG